MPWPDVGDFAQLVVAVGAVGAAGVALMNYHNDVQARRAELLYRFFDDFYRSDTYKTTRRALDGAESDEFKALKQDVETDTDSAGHEAFVDYLNFFEFLCNLVEMKRLERNDIRRLFDYYLRNLSEHEWVLRYTEKNGFEALDHEFKRLRAGGLWTNAD